MALNFSNRDPQDPNGIYSLNTQNATDAWVRDDDWSQVYYSQGDARKAGANNKVRVATAITNDGKKYDVIVGADGAPISQIGDTTGQDDDVANRWKQGPGAARPPGGSPTRTINGRVFAWNPETRAYDIPTGEAPTTTGVSTASPKVPAGSVPAIEGTPDPSKPGGYDNDRPIKAWHTPSGQVIYEELDEKERERWERGRNPGGKTDAEIRAAQSDVVGKPTGNTRQRTEGSQTIKETEYALPNGTTVWRAQTEQGRPGPPTFRPDGKGGTIIIQTMPDGSVVTTPRPDIPSDKPVPHTVTVNGVTYERGPDGKYAPAQGLPSEGQATAGGPAMPTIVVGAAQDALRAYHTALANDPSLTPAQRERRFQEAVQTANIAVSEAATQQRERESQRNFEYNTASTRLNYLQTGMNQALDFTLKLNAVLPVGSDLGGKAFAALLGLQMLQMQMSGINSLPSASRPGAPGAPGQPAAPPVPTITPADLNDPAKLDAKRAEIMANPVFRPAPPVGEPPAATAAGVPTPSTVAAAPSGPAPSAQARVLRDPSGQVSAVEPDGTILQQSGGGAWRTIGVNPAEYQRATEPYTPPAPAASAPAPATPTPPPPGAPISPPAGEPGNDPTKPIGMFGLPPGYENTPTGPITQAQTQAAIDRVGQGAPRPVETYDAGQGQSALIPSAPQFAALAPFEQQPAPPAAPSAGPDQLAANPALLAAQAAATPPWKMTEEQYLQYKAAGIPDSIILGVPGSSAA